MELRLGLALGSAKPYPSKAYPAAPAPTTHKLRRRWLRSEPTLTLTLTLTLTSNANPNPNPNQVFFAELSWNATELQQAEARAHRIGQARTVHVHASPLPNLTLTPDPTF